MTAPLTPDQLDALLLPTMAVHVSAKIASQIARLERRMDGENTARSVRG